MSFEIDNQTLDDLNIFPKKIKQDSVFDFFCKTKTTGGQNKLIELMKNPSNDFEQLSSRVEAIKFIQENDIQFPFYEKKLDFIEHYLNQNVAPLRKGWLFTLGDLISYFFVQSNEYYIIEKGLRYLHHFFLELQKYTTYLNEINPPVFFQDIINEANTIIGQTIFKQLTSIYIKNEEEPYFVKGSKNKRSILKAKIKWYFSINYFDNIIRDSKRDEIIQLISYIYLIDTLITVANAGKENNFCLPVFQQNGKSLVNIEKSFHPFVNEPVPNSIGLDLNSNMCFLTGANMAGKSTFLKSVGICCYLAHLGFPVPAAKMETSVFSGLITTINLADNVSIGYSHFYGEVKRVKNTALKIQEKRKILVIFDELFRGTNVKHAYDASLMIISAFADISQCAFFISTHIVEIADELKKKENIVFKYFESDVVNETPIYSYKLMSGISAERHGLRIVKNEKIVEILNQVAKDD